jgi:hypothetical protein
MRQWWLADAGRRRKVTVMSDGAGGQVNRFRRTGYLGGRARRWRLSCAAALLGLLVTSAAGASGAAASTARPAVRPVPPRGEHAIQAAPRIPAGARPVGALRSSAEVSGDVVLKPRDNAALTRFIADVTNENSPLFHRYLAPGAFAGRFGPTKSAINAAVSLLKADGLHVAGVSGDGLLIHFSGSPRDGPAGQPDLCESRQAREGLWLSPEFLPGNRRRVEFFDSLQAGARCVGKRR